MAENAIIDLGKLSKPATVLVKKISDAVGGIFKPGQIVRVAKAEAEAALIKAQSEIAITETHRRAMHRFVQEEARKQENMESIAAQAIPLLSVESAPQALEDDWITNFFEKSRLVSDSDMQRIWAKVLAGEANRPGTFARHTVNLISNLDRADAESFADLSCYCWDIGR